MILHSSHTLGCARDWTTTTALTNSIYHPLLGNHSSVYILRPNVRTAAEKVREQDCIYRVPEYRHEHRIPSGFFSDSESDQATGLWQNNRAHTENKTMMVTEYDDGEAHEHYFNFL